MLEKVSFFSILNSFFSFIFSYMFSLIKSLILTIIFLIGRFFGNLLCFFFFGFKFDEKSDLFV
jgi:hypothetical protein